ncbi:MAG: MBL fold metallo-hydrolase [Microthrixaceae bacterium]|nr:FprA family A-type flavoprotein [Microthrixaceae bacterium]
MDTTPTTHPPAPTERPRYRPVEIAPETWVIQDTAGEDQPGPAVHMNSMLIRGAQPVVVDTGVPDNADRYFEDLFGLVDPADVRWVFVSHDDIDHYGNVGELMRLCPDATLVTSWFLCERLGSELDVAPTRWRWLDVGDRTLSAIRPPLYDSPTTRGLFDPVTGVYWGSDCYACPVTTGTEFVDDLDPDEWAGGTGVFARWNSPWVDLVDRDRYAAECRRVEELPLRAIANTHGPTIGASDLARAHEIIRSAPDLVAPPQPGQADLDAMLAALRPGAA